MSRADTHMDLMRTDKAKARSEFIRIMKWIMLVAVLMVAGAITYLRATGDLTPDMVLATVLGVFFSVLLGCGLFAAAFFSDKSGLDDDVANATRQRDSTGH
jgi:hypothetical protein